MVDDGGYEQAIAESELKTQVPPESISITVALHHVIVSLSLPVIRCRVCSLTISYVTNALLAILISGTKNDEKENRVKGDFCSICSFHPSHHRHSFPRLSLLQRAASLLPGGKRSPTSMCADLLSRTLQFFLTSASVYSFVGFCSSKRFPLHDVAP